MKATATEHLEALKDEMIIKRCIDGVANGLDLSDACRNGHRLLTAYKYSAARLPLHLGPWNCFYNLESEWMSLPVSIKMIPAAP